MQEGEGNVRPQGPNFMGLPCLHRDIVTSCSFPFGCLGTVLYRRSGFGCDRGGQTDDGELLQSIVVRSAWPASGYPALGCLRGKQVGKWCVWWEESVRLALAFCIGTLLSKIAAWSLWLGPLCLIFNLGSIGMGADLARQPVLQCARRAPWRAALGLYLCPASHVFLSSSPPWLSWEKKVLPDLDFSWALQVLPLIGRLISNLVTSACKGRRRPKGSSCLAVPDQPCLICVLTATLLFQMSKSCRLIALCSFLACKPSALCLCF